MLTERTLQVALARPPQSYFAPIPDTLGNAPDYVATAWIRGGRLSSATAGASALLQQVLGTLVYNRPTTSQCVA